MVTSYQLMKAGEVLGVGSRLDGLWRDPVMICILVEGNIWVAVLASQNERKNFNSCQVHP
jgi:hypothetical protein